MASKEAGEERQELRIVLVGKTGAGKSTTCNMITGKMKKTEQKFKTSGMGGSQTETCQMEKFERFERMVTLVDTPGLCDTRLSAKELEKNLSGFAALSVPGPHAILLVLSAAERFTQEEVQAMRRVMDLFGKKIVDYLIIVITKTETWEDEDITPNEFLKDLPRDLKDVIPAIVLQHRSIAFQNTLRGEAADNQVRRLFAMIDSVVKANGGSHYSDVYWKQAEKELQERMEKMKEDEKNMLRELYIQQNEMFEKLLRRQCDVIEELMKMHAQKTIEREVVVVQQRRCSVM